MLSAILLLSAMAFGDVRDPSPIARDPSPVARQFAPTVKQSLTVGQHTHRCSRCGVEWSHGHDSYGNVADHTCPRCGAVQWQIHRQGSANPLPTIGPFVVPQSQPRLTRRLDCPT